MSGVFQINETWIPIAREQFNLLCTHADFINLMSGRYSCVLCHKYRGYVCQNMGDLGVSHPVTGQQRDAKR